MEWLRKFWRRHVVAPLPGGMGRCGVCNRSACDEGHFRTCPNRLKVDTPDPAEPG